jgi:hypothetical protein
MEKCMNFFVLQMTKEVVKASQYISMSCNFNWWPKLGIYSCLLHTKFPNFSYHAHIKEVYKGCNYWCIEREWYLKCFWLLKISPIRIGPKTFIIWHKWCKCFQGIQTHHVSLWNHIIKMFLSWSRSIVWPITPTSPNFEWLKVG